MLGFERELGAAGLPAPLCARLALRRGARGLLGGGARALPRPRGVLPPHGAAGLRRAAPGVGGAVLGRGLARRPPGFILKRQIEFVLICKSYLLFLDLADLKGEFRGGAVGDVLEEGEESGASLPPPSLLQRTAVSHGHGRAARRGRFERLISKQNKKGRNSIQVLRLKILKI